MGQSISQSIIRSFDSVLWWIYVTAGANDTRERNLRSLRGGYATTKTKKKKKKVAPGKYLVLSKTVYSGIE